MNQPTHTDDLVLVDRGQLAVLLSWAAHQSGGPVPLNAQTQLEHELMAAEPPDDWFNDEPEQDEDDEPDDDGEDSEDVPLSSRRRAAAAAVLVCSLLVLAGAGIAWLLVVTGP